MPRRRHLAAVFAVSAAGALFPEPARADEPAVVRVVVPACGAAAFDIDAFGRAITLELHVDGVEKVDILPALPSPASDSSKGPVATVSLEIVPCTEQAHEMVLHIVDEMTSKTVERRLTVDDLARDVRPRVLALAAAELLRASWAELRLPDAPKGALPVPPSIRLAATAPSPPPAPAPPPTPPAPPRSRFTRASLAIEGRFFPTFGSALLGPVASVSLGSADRIPLRLHLDAKALFGTSYDSAGSISVYLIAGGVGLAVAHHAGPIDVELGPHVEVGLGEAAGKATDTATTKGSSGTAAIVDASVMLTLRLDLGGAYWGSIGAEVGAVVTGLDAQAEGRRVSGFGGPLAGAALGVGRSF